MDASIWCFFHNAREQIATTKQLLQSDAVFNSEVCYDEICMCV